MRFLKLPPDIIKQFHDGEIDIPVIVYGGVENGLVHGAGGLLWRDGKCWGWMEIFVDAYDRRMTLFRNARRMLKMAAQLGETSVFVLRDPTKPSSAKLLQMLGFVFVEVNAQGLEIYECRV